MGTETEFLPFKEYKSSLSRYSDDNQLQANQYKSILESELGQSFYQKSFPSLGEAANGPMNANLPKRNTSYTIKINDKNVNVYKTFWQYKQPASSIFTDWNSAGISAVKEDISISHPPLHPESGNTVSDESLVLSNTNNVRNNFQNYGKEYLTTTNMLNTEAFLNGVSYGNGTSPYRPGTNTELQKIEHGNFNNKEDGDLLSRQVNQLRPDLPINYANNVTSWVYINPICIYPNKNHKNIKVFHERLKFGIFNLDSMKLIGDACLTESFNIIPQGYKNPTGVFNDDSQYPPVTNRDYYTQGENYFKKEGSGENLYCSANTNFVVMPKNYAPGLNGLDTSFQVFSGTNSVTLGAVMSPKLKHFIQNDLFKLNASLVSIQLYSQEVAKQSLKYPGVYWKSLPKTLIMKNIHKHFPHLFLEYEVQDEFYRLRYEYYERLSEGQKYKFLFNTQRNLVSFNEGNPELEAFINHLSIFKFGGNNVNYPNIKGEVKLHEISKNTNEILTIESPGVFTLLPTMLSQDVFGVRQNIPENYVSTENLNYNEGNNCITKNGNYQTNATNCAFRDKASMWQQKLYAGDNRPNFVPNMFNDPKNYNNDIFNLSNPYCGENSYNAPCNF